MDMHSHFARHEADESTMSTMSMTMDASEMNMVFFNAMTTPLWSSMFAPSTAGAYAGMCILLIFLSMVYRGLFALKGFLEHKWLLAARNRRYIVVADKTPAAERLSSDSKMGVLTVNGVQENVQVVQQAESMTQPWRFTVDLPRSLLVTVIVGLGYLLYVTNVSFIKI